MLVEDVNEGVAVEGVNDVAVVDGVGGSWRMERSGEGDWYSTGTSGTGGTVRFES